MYCDSSITDNPIRLVNDMQTMSDNTKLLAAFFLAVSVIGFFPKPTEPTVAAWNEVWHGVTFWEHEGATWIVLCEE